MTVFDATAMRDDIVTRLLHGEEDLETSRYLDRLVELASLEEAEHQFLIAPFDRSVALVFQLFRSKDLDPWDVDLTSFLEMFEERIKTAENIDLPTCGRLIRMAWQILRGQSSTLIERQGRALDNLEDALDLAYYDHLVENVPSGGADADIYHSFVQLKVDVANIKTILRLRHREIKGHNELLISGGSIKTELLSSVQNINDLVNALEGTKYHELVAPHFGEDKADLNSCVHDLDHYIANRTKRFSYLYPLSVLPVLDYLLRKEREVYNLRAIVRGKQTGLSSERIEELVMV